MPCLIWVPNQPDNEQFFYNTFDGQPSQFIDKMNRFCGEFYDLNSSLLNQIDCVEQRIDKSAKSLLIIQDKLKALRQLFEQKARIEQYLRDYDIVDFFKSNQNYSPYSSFIKDTRQLLRKIDKSKRKSLTKKSIDVMRQVSKLQKNPKKKGRYRTEEALSFKK